MLKIILIVLCLILLSAAIFMFILTNRQSSHLRNQAQEIAALTKYIETLQDKIASYEQQQQEDAEIPKTPQIREMLDRYLRERGNTHPDPNTVITTEELRAELEDFRLKQRFIPNIMPVTDRYVISQNYSEDHKGLDLAASLGSEVVAAGSGVIKSVYEDKYFGIVVVIDHLNHYLTFYAHLARTFYQPGFFVEKGQAIGLVGSTGFSRYPHLHFEVIYRGENINPENIFEEISE